MSRNLHTWIESATTILVLLVALGVAYVHLGPLFLTAAPPTYLEVGDSLPEISQLNYTQASSTVIVYLRSTCHYCTRTMPFIAKLKEEIDSRNRGGADFRLVAVTAEPRVLTEEYLASNGVQIPVVSTDGSPLAGVPGTPAMLTVDQEGTVLALRFGAVYETDSAAMLTALLVDGSS